jgi:phospholipid/cholesterol/gamma-HCH transport system substrate-binding protein
MLKDLSGAKLGIFIFLGSALLILGIFLLGNKQAIFKSTYNVKAYFDNVGGLREGAPVRMSGVDVGAVSEIKILGEEVGKIEVSMRLLSDISKFIRIDTEAAVETEGLVGYRYVALYTKPSAAKIVEDGGTILSREPVSIAEVIEETQGIMAYTKEMTKDLSEIVNRINRGEGTIGKILNDEELYYATTEITRSAAVSLDSITSDLRSVVAIFKSLASSVDATMANVDHAVVVIDTILVNIRDGKGVLGALVAPGTQEDSALTAILTNLDKITEEANLAALKLNENMEALKHNWLFKSYFEERGYWDAAEYQKNIDEKTEILNERIEQLEAKIKELKSLEMQK